MAFNPSSTIYLCNVPIDSTYKNQVYFETNIEQQKYFLNKVVKSFSNYLTVRKSLPDGSMQSSVKVEANIDLLQSLGCNYMYYQNANHGTKYFYAFIEKLIYINEGTTEIVFETDVYQTWLFNVQLKRSYVVREHSKSDNVGENLVPENFNYQDYNYEPALVFDSLDKWGYLITATEGLDASTRGCKITGIYQGLYFYYFEDLTPLNDFLDTLENAGGDCIQSISLIPSFCVDKNTVSDSHLLKASDNPVSHAFDFSVDLLTKDFDGYTPKNRKLYTAPYFMLYVTNHNGDEVEYKMEDFYNNSVGSHGKLFRFALRGDVSISPSVTLYPYHYKGIAENYDCGISISGFPQCSFNSDTFKLWLAKNQFGLGLDTMVNVGQIVSGVATALSTGGAGAALGVQMATSGVSGILGTMNNVYQASKEPNKSHSGSAKNNLLTAIKKNKFDIYYQTIKGHYAQTIDDFFTMYGYQTNRVKTPNVSSRPFFNYVQTIDVNIVGGIPMEDMKRLKQMYNNGVTLWKPTATIGDYSVDNSPS